MHIPSKILVTMMGKSVRAATRLRGGGSAYPGLFVEKIDPNFIKSTLSNLPMGVIVVSGTNGKTTTTKMVVELLEGQGLTVFTNRTGSNFSRGVAAALLGEITISGKLHADIAVLELDEAHAVQFVKSVAPRYSLLLNVMRDQLDRFGEIDYTTNLLRAIAGHTTDVVVLNREDARIASINVSLDNQEVYYFGLDKKLLSHFPSDDALHGTIATKESNVSADVILTNFDDDSASFMINGKSFTTKLRLRGAYNIFNAAAALALVLGVMGEKIDTTKLMASLAGVEPAFGRGETITVDGQPLELVLVKNPSGFRLGLRSFNSSGWVTMIAINDNYADGRDMSWLWDVDFSSLKTGVAEVSGIRAYDMALRLEYDEIAIGHVEQDLKLGLKHFLTNNRDQPKRIYCTYTAMLAIRKDLSKIADVEVVS